MLEKENVRNLYRLIVEGRRKKKEVKVLITELKQNIYLQNIYWNSQNDFWSFLSDYLKVPIRERIDFVLQYVEPAHYRFPCFICGKEDDGSLLLSFPNYECLKESEDCYSHKEPIYKNQDRIFDFRCSQCKESSKGSFNKTIRRRKELIAEEDDRERQERIEWLKSLARHNYSFYLETYHWKKITDLKWNEAEGRCEICGRPASSGMRLEVHHKHYDFAGEEEDHLTSLQLLCFICHRRNHGRM